MKRAIITGGAGFIGSNLTNFLLQKNWKVHVIDDLSVGKKTNLPLNNKNLTLSIFDIRDTKRMLTLVKNADFVFHLATQCVRKSINDPYLVHSVNTDGTLSILNASLRNKISRFVYISSSEVYGTAHDVPMDENHPLNPETIYGASKLTGEFYTLAFLRTYNLPCVIVRPFNTYGYNAHFEGQYGEAIPRFIVRTINNLSPQIFGNGDQTRDFTFVTDTVKGIFLSAIKGKNGEIYNIARGHEISISDVAKLVLKSYRKNLKSIYLQKRPGDVQRHFASINKAKRELGFKPTVSFKTGLKLYIKWFNDNINPDLALRYYEKTNW